MSRIQSDDAAQFYYADVHLPQHQQAVMLPDREEEDRLTRRGGGVGEEEERGRARGEGGRLSMPDQTYRTPPTY